MHKIELICIISKQIFIYIVHIIIFTRWTLNANKYYMSVLIQMRDEKEERKKQARSNKQTRQHTAQLAATKSHIS